ncbi:MAG: hypothetical protein KF715_20030 [Candidatus Didemnitutus sp.]|nr:hypothetical protein [Candidatus Didemnitutus sp.]
MNAAPTATEPLRAIMRSFEFSVSAAAPFARRTRATPRRPRVHASANPQSAIRNPQS